VTVAALCVVLMSLSLAMVPVVLYPVLKRHSAVLALGYVVFRGALEAITCLVAPVAWLLLVALGRAQMAPAASAGAAGSGFQASGVVLLAAADHSALAGIIFCLGALMFYTVLLRSRLVPRWISVWGLAAVVPYLAAEFLAMFALVDPMSSTAALLFIPMAVQEMVLAVWLIVKGFSEPVNASQSAKPEAHELLAAA